MCDPNCYAMMKFLNAGWGRTGLDCCSFEFWDLYMLQNVFSDTRWTFHMSMYAFVYVIFFWFVTALCHLNIRLRIDLLPHLICPVGFCSMWIEFELNISCSCSLLSVPALVMCVLFSPLFGVCFLCVHMPEGWCVLLFLYIYYVHAWF